MTKRQKALMESQMRKRGDPPVCKAGGQDVRHPSSRLSYAASVAPLPASSIAAHQARHPSPPASGVLSYGPRARWVKAFISSRALAI
jgi:hypothetical protein